MRTRSWIFLAILATAAVTAVVTTVLVSVFERKQEARQSYFRVVEITDDTEDPALWGKNFPQQYDGWKRTVDQVRTRYGGSEALPRAPDDADPRSVVSQSKLEEDPRLKTMWAGYAFAVDFREERGHAYMLDDQTYTQRQQAAKQPGTCIHCHASVYVAYKRLGGGNLTAGFEKLNQMPYAEARKEVTHPVGCIDCHEPTSLALRVTRPAFIEGLRALRNDPTYDPNTQATRQEMRAYVCGQCHVEYHFKGPEKRLVYPWAKGLKADEILAYYDEAGFSDWTHAETGAKVLKAQHPEFEMWNQGIHARSGVACADCHMPYVRVGAQKVSDHQVKSPLLSVNRSCQPCHRWQEEEIRARAEEIQARFFGERNRAFDALVALVGDVKKAREAGATDAALEPARAHQRRAQFLLDFVEAENSTGFHAPGESLRLLAQSIDHARQGQLALRDAAATPVPAATAPPP